MSIDINDVKKKVQQYLSLYSFYMSSYRHSFNKLVELVNSYYKYIADIKKQIINEEELFETIKTEMLKEEKFGMAYRTALCSMYPSFDTPVINLFVSTLSSSSCLDKDMVDRINNDPRFKELDKEDFDKLYTHVSNAIIIMKLDKQIKHKVKTRYAELCQTNTDYIELSRIVLSCYIHTLLIKNANKHNFHLSSGGNGKSDKELISQLLRESKSFSLEKLNEILQEISNRISTYKFSPLTYIAKEGDKILGSYVPDLHSLNINSMLFFNSYIDKSYDNLIVTLETLSTVEHENNHSNNHMLAATIISQIFTNPNITVEDIVNKIKTDRSIFIACATLVESSYVHIISDDRYYSSLIDEQNSRNSEFRFLENMIEATPREEIKHKIRCMYDLSAESEKSSKKEPHIHIIVKAIKNVIGDSSNPAIEALYKVMDALEQILIDPEYERELYITYFPYLHQSELLDRHRIDAEDPIKKEIKETMDQYFSNLYFLNEEKKRDIL